MSLIASDMGVPADDREMRMENDGGLDVMAGVHVDKAAAEEPGPASDGDVSTLQPRRIGSHPLPLKVVH
jgi:hypothetical protein